MKGIVLAMMVMGATAERPAIPLQGPPESFLDEPKTAPMPLERRWPRALGMATLIGGVTVAGIVGLTRAQRRRGLLVPSEAIHLRAVRSLGGKQRIALVEVGGERLLLSTNDREVTLLTHLPQEPAAEAALTPQVQPEVQVPENGTQPFMAPTVAAVEAALDQREEAQANPVAYAPATLHADLAGLRQWQERAAQERRA